MNISKVLIFLFIVLAMLVSPESYAQQAAAGTGDYGFIRWMKNAEGVALYAVQFVMVMAGVGGVVVGIMAIATFKDNVSANPQSGQPRWGLFAGEFVFAAACLSSSAWIYAITSSLSGDGGNAGAGSKVHDRYKGNSTP